MTTLIASVVAVVAIAIGASLASVPFMALMFVMPSLVFIQHSRTAAYGVAFSYYSAASWALMPGARNFLGPTPVTGDPVLLWFAASALLSAPWSLVWTTRPHKPVWRVPLGLVVSVVPPLGIIGWASPLTSAGVLFPGTGWVGLIATAVVPGVLIVWPKTVAPTVLALALLSNLMFPGLPAPPKGWEAIDTWFGGISHGLQSPIAEFTAAETIQKRAKASDARVIVFPETVVPLWTEATEIFWHQTLADLRASGKTLVVGVGLPVEDRPRMAYRNAILIAGNETGVFFQRIPVPLGMWRPFSGGGVPLNVLGPVVMQLAGQRAAIFICYEQLLTWPVLRSMASDPTVVLAVANDYWATKTPIPRCQSVATQSWCRLFFVPLLSATNR